MQDQELPRMQMLLGACQAEDDYGGVDTATACMVAILDHFVQQSTEKESAKLRDLLPLVPQLQKLTEGDEDGQMVEGGAGGAAAGEPPPQQVTREEVRVRASRILLRLGQVSQESSREPPQLEAFGPRAHILEVLMRHSEASQEGASHRVSQTREHCKAQTAHIAAGRLAEEPCVNQQTLQDFCEKVGTLAESRHFLGLKMSSLNNGLEALGASLDQRRVKHGIVDQDVQELSRSLHGMAGDATRSAEVHSELAHCEELNRQSVAEVEQLSAQLREAQAWNQNSASKVKEAERHTAELSSKEAELADFCNHAPAKLQQCQARLLDVESQRADATARCAALGLEADRFERRTAALRGAMSEASAALVALEDVGRELEVLKSSLNSELVMSAGEVEKLKSLEARLAPAKPGRMRRSASNTTEEEQSDAGLVSSSSREVLTCDTEPPTWDDSQAEQEFRDNLHFRSFKKLRDEKERSWREEKKWLQECMQHAEAAAAKLEEQRREAQRLDHQSTAEEGELRKEIGSLEDVEGHAQRHLDARAAADAARASQRELATMAAEAAGAEWAVKSQLEKAQAKAAQVAVQLENARKAAASEEDETLKVRRELQKRFLELETRVREFVQDWRAYEHDGQRLTLLQERVASGLREESEGRRAVRSEVQKLIEVLQDLDQQQPAQLTCSSAANSVESRMNGTSSFDGPFCSHQLMHDHDRPKWSRPGDLLIAAHGAAPRVRLRTSLQEFASAGGQYHAPPQPQGRSYAAPAPGPGHYSSGQRHQGYASQGDYYGHQGGHHQGHYDYGAPPPSHPPGPYGPYPQGPGAAPAADTGEELPLQTDAMGNEAPEAESAEAVASSTPGDAETTEEAQVPLEEGDQTEMPPEEFYEEYPPEEVPPEEMYPEEMPPEEAAEPQALVIQVPGISNHLYESYPTGAMLGKLKQTVSSLEEAARQLKIGGPKQDVHFWE
ncbi:TMPRSS13 [Symbiodinium natans]|uniref:TMPRSS13 protein n=1 Tax=Symbiodinium natans TaxID=878477 RepID=A0A812I824_9DINO|nr:TMPRSS13 [Symbiodinium natans]